MIFKMPGSIYNLDANILSILTSFLHPREIKILGYGHKSIHNQIRSFMTYSYNQHGDMIPIVKYMELNG
jgi:hypothetical protein